MKKIFCFLLFVICLNGQDNDTSSKTTKEKKTVKSNIDSGSSAIINTEDYIKVSLVDVVLETVSQSNNAKSAREKLRQAKLKIDNARSGYLPTLDGTYSLAGTNTTPSDDTNSSSKNYKDQSYKLTLRQNLYKGGFTSATIKNLQKKYEVEKNNYKLAIEKEVENAIKAYFEVLFNFETYNVNRENMERLQEILEIITIQYQSGATSLGNLSNIKASVSNAESQLIRIQSKFNQSLEFYEYIVGEKFKQTFPYEQLFDTSVDDFEDIAQKAVENNMVVQNFNLNIKAEKINLLVATSSFKPTVDLELSAENVLDQEDYIADEKNYKAQIVFSYNFYNQGKDKNKVLTVNSKIRELVFRKREEIRKLKWSLSKLYRSIVSIQNASESKQEEVESSKDMVNAYWDGFKLGEQDLQELLQGQRQLNSAQIELIRNKQTTITDYFKLLSSTGDLLNFFRLDIDADNYIDFTKSDYRNLLKTEAFDDKKESTVKSLETDKPSNDLSEIMEAESKSQEDSLSDLLEYKKEFLAAANNKWTIVVQYFDKVYQALDFAQENNISKNSFLYDTLNGEKLETGIAYNMYDTKKLAQKALDDLEFSTNNSRVANVKEIKKAYNDIENKRVQTKIETKIQLKERKAFRTNSLFKKKFLDANKEYYTINVTSLSSMKQAEELVMKEKIFNDSFVFTYGEKDEWVKVVYGVYKTYEEAENALNQMQKLKDKYEPIIELINGKQALYNKYKKEEVIEKPIEEPMPEVLGESTNSFKERFLRAPKNYYTINVVTMSQKKNIKKFERLYGKKYELFLFKIGKMHVYYKAMIGIYGTKEEALKVYNTLSPELLKNKPKIEKIGKKQKLYSMYNDENIKETKEEVKNKVKKDVEKPKKLEQKSAKSPVKQKILNDASFKEQFLNAPGNYYTINLATIMHKKDIKSFKRIYGKKLNLFIFEVGDKHIYYKAMTGVFKTQKEAFAAYENLSANLKKNKPNVELISLKQNDYFKFNTEMKNGNLVEKN